MSTDPRIRRIWAAVIVAAAAAIAATTVVVAGSSARTSAPAPKPTVVLVHGAWADASSWDGVIARLQADGFPTVAVANPLRSLSGDAAYVASVLASIKGPIVLVGHSYGGAVISEAAVGNANVKALVYVDAFAPAAGESVLQLAGMNPGSELPTAITEVPYSEGSTGQAGVDVYIKSADFRSAFAADVPAATARLMAVTQRPIALAALMEQASTPAWASIPSWYLVGLDDKAIPPATQEFMARRAKSHVVEIQSSHASLVSHPDAVVNLIIAASRSVG
jgi:pimeloyl-ACP methyl ester carboxylesterase